MKKRLSVSLGFLLLLAVVFAYGQQMTLKVPVSFPFMVVAKTLPAGEYQLMKTENGAAFRIMSGDKEGALAMVVTRLSRDMRLPEPSSYVVFDKYEDHYHLSEIWFPGEDGYLVNTTTQKHTHETVMMK